MRVMLDPNLFTCTIFNLFRLKLLFIMWSGRLDLLAEGLLVIGKWRGPVTF